MAFVVFQSFFIICLLRWEMPFFVTELLWGHSNWTAKRECLALNIDACVAVHSGSGRSGVCVFWFRGSCHSHTAWKFWPFSVHTLISRNFQILRHESVARVTKMSHQSFVFHVNWMSGIQNPELVVLMETKSTQTLNTRKSWDAMHDQNSESFRSGIDMQAGQRNAPEGVKPTPTPPECSLHTMVCCWQKRPILGSDAFPVISGDQLC